MFKEQVVGKLVGGFFAAVGVAIGVMVMKHLTPEIEKSMFGGEAKQDPTTKAQADMANDVMSGAGTI